MQLLLDSRADLLTATSRAPLLGLPSPLLLCLCLASPLCCLLRYSIISKSTLSYFSRYPKTLPPPPRHPLPLN